jgi:hypothetical protein
VARNELQILRHAGKYEPADPGQVPRPGKVAGFRTSSGDANEDLSRLTTNTLKHITVCSICTSAKGPAIAPPGQDVKSQYHFLESSSSMAHSSFMDLSVCTMSLQGSTMEVICRDQIENVEPFKAQERLVCCCLICGLP